MKSERDYLLYLLERSIVILIVKLGLQVFNPILSGSGILVARFNDAPITDSKIYNDT
jgi:hypothetical protein